MDLQSIEHRCLVYHYTKCGRWTPSFNHRCLEYQYTNLADGHPSQSNIDALNTTTPNLADGPPSIKQSYLEYHYTTWQMDPLQSGIDALNTASPNMADGLPQSIEHRCLVYHYTKLGRWTPLINHRCCEYWYTKLGRWTPCQSNIDVLNTTTANLADGHPSQSNIDAFNTTTPNLADEPPFNWAQMPWMQLHQPWQMDPPVNQT